MPLSFNLGANTAVRGKLSRDASFEPVTTAKNWKTERYTIDRLCRHIQQGCAWMPGLLDGKRRLQENVVSSCVLTADIDEGWTIQEAKAHPFVQEYCALGVTSASHTEEQHKFRLVFILPEALNGFEEIKGCNELLIDYLEVSDKSCKDASRFYYGNTNAQIFLRQEVVLPENWMQVMSQAIVSRDIEPHLEASAKFNQDNAGEDLETFIKQQIYPRFDLKGAFNWTGHKWAKEDRRTGKLRGSCPWHESQSGTAFYAQIINGAPLWRCPSCDIGGDLISYRHRMQGGDGKPRGKAFVETVAGLAKEVSLELPKREQPRPEQGSIQEIKANGSTPVDQNKPEKVMPSYEEALDRIDYLEQEFPSQSELEWQVLNYIKDSGLNTLGIRSGQLVKMARARRDGEEAIEVIDAIDILEDGEDSRDWIIPGLIPLGSTIVFAASGGSGKTSAVYNFSKHIALGRPWSGYPVAQGKVLIVQADEPRVDIRDKLDIGNYHEVPRGLVHFITKWRFSQIRQLEAVIKKLEPRLVVIDSYTAAHAGTGAELTRSSAGDNIYTLRDIAQAQNCSFIIIHHHNKMNELRDSSTINDNASEIWSMYHDEKASADRNELVLEISKSRAGLSGKYLFRRDPVDYSWQHCGAIDGVYIHLDRVIIKLKAESPKTFTPKQIEDALNISFQEAAATLEQGRRLGLIQFEWKHWEKDGQRGRFRVYFHQDGFEVKPKPVLQPQHPLRSVVTAVTPRFDDEYGEEW